MGGKILYRSTAAVTKIDLYLPKMIIETAVLPISI